MDSTNFLALLIVIALAFVVLAVAFRVRRNFIGTALSALIGLVVVGYLGGTQEFGSNQPPPPAPKYKAKLSANRDTFGPRVIRFDPAKHKGPTGKIITPLKGDLTITLFKDQRGDQLEEWIATGKNGAFILPPGHYSLLDCSQVVSHNGVKWRLSSRLPMLRDLNIQRNSTTRLEIGPPYTGSVEVKQRRRGHVELSLNLTGRGGETCQITSPASSNAPKFQILSKSGAVLQEGAFEFG